MSDRLDPYWNLAVEEWLLDRAASYPPVLFLWRSRPAVIIGKNQNPWRECNLTWMREHDVQLARRLSGGGAVYHDEGNLNYAFFMPREDYREKEIYERVISALASLNIRAEQMNRNSLAVDGLKISGNAFCFRRNAALHHGTLLVSADLERLRASLDAPALDIRTRAIDSKRARVTNLRDMDATLTVERVVEALKKACHVGSSAVRMEEKEAAAIAIRFRSEDWLWGQTPEFTYHVKLAGDAGDICVRVREGRVADITGMDSERADSLRGHVFDPEKVSLVEYP